MPTKPCKTCGIPLDIPETWTASLQRQRNYRCRGCNSDYTKEVQAAYRAKNREKAIAAAKKWRTENPEKYQEQLAIDRERRRERRNTK